MRLHRALLRIFADLPSPRLTPLTRAMFRRLGSGLGGASGFALRHVGNPVVWLFAGGYLQQEPFTNALIRDTIALTVLRAGYKPNVIPERAEAVLDCRLLPDTDQDAFLERLRRTIDDPHVRIEVVQRAEPAPPSPTDHPFYEAITTAAEHVYPDAVAVPFMTLGGTDSRFFRRRGVPAYGLIPMLVSRAIVATAHGIDERIPAAALGPAVRVVYEALVRAAAARGRAEPSAEVVGGR